MYSRIQQGNLQLLLPDRNLIKSMHSNAFLEILFTIICDLAESWGGDILASPN